MRWLAAAVVLFLLPTASAASQVHATYLGDLYAVTFVSNATDPSVPVTWEGGQALATRVNASDGDIDVTFRAEIPARAISYTVEGRTFTLPAPPAAHESARLVFVADMGTDANARGVLAAMMREDPSLVLVGGDLSYANGNASLWNKWFGLVEPLAANIPLMPAFGNHEDYCEEPDHSLHHCGPGRNGWHTHFALPNGDNLYYAFDWGPLHITVLDTEAYAAPDPFTDADDQESFLSGSLEDADGRWNVVMYHRPLRTTNAKEGLASGDARAGLGPLLDGRADLVLQAHAHSYERAHDQNGTTFVTSGGGGRSLYLNWTAQEPWVATRAAEFHFLVLDASPSRIEVRALRPDGSTLDSFTLERAAPPMPTATPTATRAPSATPTPTISRPPDPTHADVLVPTIATNASGSIGESNTSAPGLLALALVLTLSGRLTKRLFRE